jgi:predicted secreted hydrolase
VVFQVVILGMVGYLSHFAITDLKKGVFSLGSRTSLVDQRGATGGFNLEVGGWKMAGHAGKDSLSAELPGYALQLSLSASKPVVFQYGTGWMTVGSVNPFYYYSYTRMAATGLLTVDGQPKNVTGEAWMDHQWGDMGSDFKGWDWYSLRLDDQSELMLFTVRKSGQAGFSGGTLIDPAGVAEELKGSDFLVSSTGQWTSPHNGAVYPQGWTLSVPRIGLEVKLAATLPDQEFYESFLGWSPIYWEGLCTVTGTRAGKPVGGYAYVELTSYNKP